MFRWYTTKEKILMVLGYVLLVIGVCAIIPAIIVTADLIFGWGNILGYWGLLLWLGIIPALIGFLIIKKMPDPDKPY